MSAPVSPGQEVANEPGVETKDQVWKGLYRIGGAAALLIGIFYVTEISVVAATGVPPSTAIAWFELLQNNRLVGIFDLFPLDIVSVSLMTPMFLALYVALRRGSQTWMAIATAVGLLGVADFFATNTAMSMLSLSNQYAAATTDTQRAVLLTLGQQLLAASQTTGQFMANTLNCAAGLIISFVMLRSSRFGKSAAAVGILGNGLEVLPFVPPSIVALVIAVGGVFLVIWYILIARSLLRFGKEVSKGRPRDGPNGGRSLGTLEPARDWGN